MMRRYAHFLARPSAPYFIILTSVTALSGLGLVMVLSASSVKSFEQTGTTYSIFLKQLLFLSIALGLTYYASRMKIDIWKKIAKAAIPLGFVGLLLPQLPFIGREINGNRSWIGLGPFTLQPAEFAKLGLILFCAMQLTRFEERVTRNPHVTFTPWQLILYLMPGASILLVMIMLGKDLGTALIVMAIAAAMIFLSGTPVRHFSAVAFTGVALAAAFIITQPNRLHRFQAVLHPFDPQVYKFAGWQTAHSVMGLASGGLFGVGLGASRQKWGNLSEANTDFIFSVIGEELGLIGTLLVLSLFGALLYGIFRTALHTKDSFSRYTCAGVGAWLLFQITVNIASDIGIFPVVGVTLPFISYGGSSLIANFLGIALVLNVLRRDPEVKASIASRKEVRHGN
jgi:cell division protein FtsW